MTCQLCGYDDDGHQHGPLFRAWVRVIDAWLWIEKRVRRA